MARRFVGYVYKLTETFPPSEKFGMVIQLRKAAVSVSSNIAEGCGRHTSKDKAHFYTQAFTSLMEALNQLIISTDLQWLSTDKLMSLRAEIDQVAQKLSKLRSSTNQ